MSDPRLVALEAIIDILERDKFADDVLSSVLDKYELSKKDKALVTELVYGVTRYKLTLDFLLSKVCKKDLKSLSFKLKNILRLGAYQLEFTRIPAYAAVNSCVEITKQIENVKQTSLVNGVLRGLIRKRNDIKFPKISKTTDYALSIKYSHPKWLVKRWLDRYGLDSTISLLSYNNMPSQVTINVNTLKSDLNEVLKELEDAHICSNVSEISPNSLKLGNPGQITKLPGYFDGHWFVQNEVSSLVVDILKPQQDDFVIDMCAAPGTKTIQIANYMNNTGRIIAIDTSKTRLKRVNENCYRLGATNIECVVDDARIFTLEEGLLADKILVDAPCTNTGVFSKRADARWHRRPKDLAELRVTQAEILSNASKLLKSNGLIVYSVCSIEPEEGIEIINEFLKTNSDFILIDIKEFLPDTLKNAFETKYVQFLPFEHMTDGFFIACLKKL
ncbi:MAG: 16S rRNA (cytosine(967)-C(5))-methyltransferase RsmB [Vampirovibrionia bacterium]